VQRIGLAGKFGPQLQPVFAAPSTTTEAVLARLWCEVLGIERVGGADNFFALGGDSLLAARVAARLEATWSVKLPVAALFRAPRLADQALLLEEAVLEQVEAMPEDR
jgi:hypothetical protein